LFVLQLCFAWVDGFQVLIDFSFCQHSESWIIRPDNPNLEQWLLVIYACIVQSMMMDEYDSISTEVKNDKYLDFCGFEVFLQGKL